MTSIESRFEELRAKREKALILFLTAGDQPLKDLPDVVETLIEGGADLIETGFPFSDPFGEGPTIQASSQRSLERGTTTSSILAALSTSAFPVPLVGMGYYNNFLRPGLADFARSAKESGLSGMIISDLVPDEGEQWERIAKEDGLDTIYLAAPTSTDERIRQVCEKSTGFVYAVSRTGVTGVQNDVSSDVPKLVDKLKTRTDRPVCVGFGISKPEHVRSVCKYADGAVVGSFIVDLLHQEWPNGRNKIVQAIRELKEATR